MSLADLEPEVVRAELLAPPDAGRRIAERIEAVRRSVVRCRAWTRRLLAASVFAVLAAVSTWTDYRAELPTAVRAMLSIAVVAAAALTARRGLPNRADAYRREDAAADLERRLESLGQRLRTTVDYQSAVDRPAAAAPSLLRALEDDTYVRSRETDFSQLIDRRPVAAAAVLVTVLSAAWLAALAASPEWRIATGRQLLLPWQYTQVSFSPTEATIKAGESLEIAVQIDGRPVRSALVRYRPVGGDDSTWRSLPLRAKTEQAEGAERATESGAQASAGAATESSGESSGVDAESADSTADSTARPLVGPLTARLVDCQVDLEFRVEAGPIPLPVGRVVVLQPLTVESVTSLATPPAYVRRPAVKAEGWSLKVLEGSDVAVEVVLSRPAETAAWQKIDKPAAAGTPGADQSKGAAAPALESQLAGDRLRLRLGDLRASGVWELTARTADGVDLEPQRLQIRVQLDGRAQVRFLAPEEELEVVPTAEVEFEVEGGDDLGLVRIGVAAQVADGPMQTLWQQELPSGTTESVRGAAVLRLEDHSLTFQDGVTYYAFADDNYFGEDRRTVTPLRFVDIRPFKRAYQMLDTGGT